MYIKKNMHGTAILSKLNTDKPQPVINLSTITSVVSIKVHFIFFF